MHRNRPLPRTRPIALAASAALAALLLNGCATTPDPEETRDSLAEVTEEPAQPDAADEYSVETLPEPIVEPLECLPYLVVTARGTGEPSRGQLLSPVARAISEARPNDTLVLDLEYPAAGEVKESSTVGVRMLIDTLNVQSEACEEQRFLLLGYSQGALVVGDALLPAEHRIVGATVGAVSDGAADRILAIVLYGDPRFVGAEPYNIGNYDHETNGLLPRSEGALGVFADRLRDYCVARDFICQGGIDLEEPALDERGHVAYFENGMQQDGAAFAITRLDPVGDTDETAESDAAERAEEPGETEQPE